MLNKGRNSPNRLRVLHGGEFLLHCSSHLSGSGSRELGPETELEAGLLYNPSKGCPHPPLPAMPSKAVPPAGD